MYARLDGGTRRPVRDFEVNDLVLQPFCEACDAVAEVASGLVLGVLDREDVDGGEGCRESGAEVGGECAEGVVAAFEAVEEDEEEGFFHGRQCWGSSFCETDRK